MINTSKLGTFWALLASLAALLTLKGFTHSASASDAAHFDFGQGRLTVPLKTPIGNSQWEDTCKSSTRLCGKGSFSASINAYVFGGRLSPEEAKSPLQCEPGAVPNFTAQTCVRYDAGSQTLTWMRRFGDFATGITVAPLSRQQQERLLPWFGEISWSNSR